MEQNNEDNSLVSTQSSNTLNLTPGLNSPLSKAVAARNSSSQPKRDIAKRNLFRDGAFEVDQFDL